MGAELIGIGDPPTMRWTGNVFLGRITGRLDRGGIDVDVYRVANGDWAVKVNGKELCHDGAPRYFYTFRAAEVAAEVEARSLWGGQ